MRYMGGKSRIAREIAEILDGELLKRPSGERVFVSLFCGGCAVETKVTAADRIILNDKQKYLIALLRGVAVGYELPDTMTEAQWRYIRDHKEEDPVLTGFAGFGCSFGGRWFRSFGVCKKESQPCGESKRSLLKSKPMLQRAEILCGDYRKVPIPPGSVIYADPPYEGCEKYGGEDFDTKAFWEWVRKLAKDGHTVFVSELNVPDDFKCVWKKQFRSSMNGGAIRDKYRIEKLIVPDF